MALIDVQEGVQNTFNAQGYLVKDPTDLSAAFPHGGAPLGLYRSVVWKITATRAEITAEEYANLPVELIEGAESIIVAATLREYNQTSLAAVFPSTSAGGVQRTKTTQRGSLGSDRAIKLLISPLSTEDQPALLIPRAIPLVAEAADIAFHLDEEWGVPVMLMGIPDATGRLYELNTLGNMTL